MKMSSVFTALRMQGSVALNFKAVNDDSSVYPRTTEPLINRKPGSKKTIIYQWLTSKNSQRVISCN
jgi:hypothetical protein